MEDAFTADAFVQGASLHDDRHRQQDLLTDILLQAAGKREMFRDDVRQTCDLKHRFSFHFSVSAAESIQQGASGAIRIKLLLACMTLGNMTSDQMLHPRIIILSKV